MGLLTGTQLEYYQGDNYGGYQFTSLNDIIDYFMVVYVGDQKIIQKASRIDVAFHAQRAMQELSFDTFKSIKSYQIDIPSSLVMPLPHDYVNYTRLTWVDTSGIKHPMYHTKDTSNPFQIRQDDHGEYMFPEEAEEVLNGDFSDQGTVFLKHWTRSSDPYLSGDQIGGFEETNEICTFFHKTRTSHGESDWGHTMCIHQLLDVSDKSYIDLKATGQAVNLTNGDGILRVGLSTNPPDTNTRNLHVGTYAAKTTNTDASMFDLLNTSGESSYIEWVSADGAVEKERLEIDVRNLTHIYIIAVSWHDFTGSEATLTGTNNVDDISVVNSLASETLGSPINNRKESSTWNNYKSITPSENNNDDYEDDRYWSIAGERYGLEPSHAQTNGSFFIDPRLGRIHFSSNISGKTIILDYISDGLGTDEEMIVHKFAEEAMYKYITHAILSTSSYGQALVPRLTKEKFAAIRKAKLRLSNIKLEDLTQVLRGKSKHIKH